jgi:hypothetical protein
MLALNQPLVLVLAFAGQSWPRSVVLGQYGHRLARAAPEKASMALLAELLGRCLNQSALQ